MDIPRGLNRRPALSRIANPSEPASEPARTLRGGATASPARGAAVAAAWIVQRGQDHVARGRRSSYGRGRRAGLSTNCITRQIVMACGIRSARKYASRCVAQPAEKEMIRFTTRINAISYLRRAGRGSASRRRDGRFRWFWQPWTPGAVLLKDIATPSAPPRVPRRRHGLVVASGVPPQRRRRRATRLGVARGRAGGAGLPAMPRGHAPAGRHAAGSLEAGF